MKEFKSKGFPGKYGGGRPHERKKRRGHRERRITRPLSLTEDLVWELRTFAADHRYRG